MAARPTPREPGLGRAFASGLRVVCEALREGSVVTMDVESIASAPLVELPYVDMRPKGPASSSPSVEASAL